MAINPYKHLNHLLYKSVFGERCTVDSDCESTVCTSPSEVICQHPESDVKENGGLCTCAGTSGMLLHKYGRSLT